ncbi:flagellar biosynthetic protein FliO [bacterium]|nr:flagellar biosynthetic protein FliO [bacterium]
MQGYFIQFMAYTMAMVGFLSICMITYKKLCIQSQTGKNSDCLCIENVLKINPKKQIYVVRAGKERFLVASDAETTTMLAKLDNYSENTKQTEEIKEKIDIKNAISLSSFKKFENSKKTINEIPAFKRIKEKMEV